MERKFTVKTKYILKDISDNSKKINVEIKINANHTIDQSSLFQLENIFIVDRENVNVQGYERL